MSDVEYDDEFDGEASTSPTKDRLRNAAPDKSFGYSTDDFDTSVADMPDEVRAGDVVASSSDSPEPMSLTATAPLVHDENSTREDDHYSTDAFDASGDHAVPPANATIDTSVDKYSRESFDDDFTAKRPASLASPAGDYSTDNFDNDQPLDNPTHDDNGTDLHAVESRVPLQETEECPPFSNTAHEDSLERPASPLYEQSSRTHEISVSAHHATSPAEAFDTLASIERAQASHPSMSFDASNTTQASLSKSRQGTSNPNDDLLCHLVMSLAAQPKPRPIVKATVATQTDVPPSHSEIPPFKGSVDPAAATAFNEQYIQFIQHLAQKGRGVNCPLPRSADAAARTKHRIDNALHATVCQVFSNPKMIATIRDIVFTKVQPAPSTPPNTLLQN